jgi:hypothetical protein
VPAARISLAGTSGVVLTDAEGRFTIADAMPGAYTVEVRTPSLDSIAGVHETQLTFTNDASPFPIIVPSASQVVATLCSNAPAMQGPGAARGIVAGRVIAPGAAAEVRNVRVVAEWADATADTTGSANAAARYQWIATRSDARGVFRFCGVPTGVSLFIWAEGETRISPRVPTTIAAGQSYGYVSLLLDSAASPGAEPLPPHAMPSASLGLAVDGRATVGAPGRFPPPWGHWWGRRSNDAKRPSRERVGVLRLGR